MKFLVAGGEGFVGSHLVRALDNAVALDDRSYNKYFGEKTIIKSILDKDIEDVVKNFDFVINSACHDIRNSISKPIADAENNILGTLNLLKACRKYKIPFLYISSASVHTESNHYSLSKLAGEKYTVLYRQWIPTYVVRLSNVFGKGDTESVIGKWLSQDKITLINPHHTRDFTYIDDSIAGILKIIEKRPFKIYDIGSGVETQLGDLAQWFKKKTGKEIVNMKPREIDNVKERCIDIRSLRNDLDFEPKWDIYQALEFCINDYFYDNKGKDIF